MDVLAVPTPLPVCVSLHSPASDLVVMLIVDSAVEASELPTLLKELLVEIDNTLEVCTIS